MRLRILLLLFVQIGCNTTETKFNHSDPDQEHNHELQFSFKNNTAFELYKIVVGLPDTVLHIDYLAPNDQTEWTKITSSYNYGFLKFKDSRDSVYIMEPIDYVGEILFKSGSMTFIVEKVETSETNF